MRNCAACGNVIGPADRWFTAAYQDAQGAAFPNDVQGSRVCEACWGAGAYPDYPRGLILVIRARAGGQAVQQVQHLYAPSRWLPEDERASTPATLIRLPAACPACAAPIAVFELGTPACNGFLKQGCDCIRGWPTIVALRVHGEPEQAPAAQQALQTFGRCTHCGDVNPYQSGDFLCYQCTQDPWR